MTRLASLLVLALLLAFAPASASAMPEANGVSSRSEVVDFGTHPVGETVVQPVWVVNDGSETIQLGPLGIVDRNRGGDVGAFGQSGGTCFQSETIALEPGQSCTVDITFTPQRPGEFKSELVIAVDAFTSSLGFALRGTGANA